jgi:hypothetical protein
MHMHICIWIFGALPGTLFGFHQCSRSETFWNGSRSADPHHWITDPDLLFPTAAFKMSQITSFFYVSAYYVHLHQSSKITTYREVSTLDIKVFLHFFPCWWKDPDSEQDNDGVRSRVQNLMDPTDPEYWFTSKGFWFLFTVFGFIFHTRWYLEHGRWPERYGA